MKLGLLGGTFDPVHLGHLVLAETAREQLTLDRVLFVPAGRPWRKAARRITLADHRLAMLRLAIEDNPAFLVETVEMETPGPSYTAETLEWLHAREPGGSVWFIIGEDALADMPHWHRPERILALASLAVARRPQTGRPAGRGESAPAPGGLSDARLVWLDMPLLGISASAVRERVRRGVSVRYLVPDAVERYIREQGLYRA